MSKKLSDAQWQVQTKEKEIITLKKDIEELKILIEFYDHALKYQDSI